MTYSRAGRMISVEMNDLLGGARPGLYIGTPRELLKVGTFGNEEKAKKFEEWLEYLFGDRLERAEDGERL